MEINNSATDKYRFVIFIKILNSPLQCKLQEVIPIIIKYRSLENNNKKIVLKITYHIEKHNKYIYILLCIE